MTVLLASCLSLELLFFNLQPNSIAFYDNKIAIGSQGKKKINEQALYYLGSIQTESFCRRGSVLVALHIARIGNSNRKCSEDRNYNISQEVTKALKTVNDTSKLLCLLTCSLIPGH